MGNRKFNKILSVLLASATFLTSTYVHIAELIGRVCEAKRPHSVSERSARALS